MKKYYSYIRVSTTKQGEGVSLIEQTACNERYAASLDLQIVEQLEEIETAAKQGRPVFSRMIKLLKQGKADGVIIHKIDRSARNFRDWAEITNLIDLGIEVHFSHEGVDMKTRGGRLSANLQAVIAEDYIRNLRQEAIKGLYGRLKQGIYPFQAPTGYKDTGKGNYKSIDPVQGPLVRKAFELYATRKYTLETLLPHMDKLGLRNMKGRKMALSGLSILLHNPFYAGILKVKGQTFKGGHDPLITPTLFKTVQSIIEGNTNQKVNKHEFKFSKMVKCHECHFSMIGEIQKGHKYYRCHTKGCKTKTMRESTLDNLLSKSLVAVSLTDSEHADIEELLHDTEKDWFSKQQELVVAIKLQKGKIDQKLERLTDCYLENTLDRETFEKRKEKLLFESKTTEANEKELLAEQGSVFRKTRRFLELSNSLIKSYELATMNEQRDMLRIVTSNIEISLKKLIVSMKIPFREMSERYFLTSGGPEHYPSRIMYQPFVFSDKNTSPILGMQLSKEKLKLLLDQIMLVVGQLPEDYFKNEYGI